MNPWGNLNVTMVFFDEIFELLIYHIIFLKYSPLFFNSHTGWRFEASGGTCSIATVGIIVDRKTKFLAEIFVARSF